MTVGSGGTSVSKSGSILSKTDNHVETTATILITPHITTYSNQTLSIYSINSPIYTQHTLNNKVLDCQLFVGTLTLTYSASHPKLNTSDIDITVDCSINIALDGLKINDKILITANPMYNASVNSVATPPIILINAQIKEINISNTVIKIINVTQNITCYQDIVTNNLLKLRVVSIIPY